MVTKLGQFKKLKCRGGSPLCKLSQLCYQFLKHSQLSPALPRPRFIDESILPKKLRFQDIFQKKVTSLNKDINPGDLCVCMCECMLSPPHAFSRGLSSALGSHDQFQAPLKKRSCSGLDSWIVHAWQVFNSWIARIAKSCLEKISLVFKVSKFSY